MTELLYFTLVGLCIGAAYALVGSGISALFSGTGVLNFGQGEFVMIAALFVAVQTQRGENFILASLGASLIVLAVSFVVGLLFMRSAKSRRRDIDLIILATVGLSILLANLTGVLLGDQTYSVVSPMFGEGIAIGEFHLSYDYVAIVVVAAVVFILLAAFYRHTNVGIQMQAMSFDVEAARLSGVAVGRLTVVSWLLAGVVAAIGGCLLGSVILVHSTMGLALTISGFAAAMIGGLRRPMGAILGGIILGLAETYAARYLGTSARQLIAPLVIIIVIVLLPAGILSARSVATRKV
ncbi:hypothetical protein AU252_00905 [Pseudarthrobacter sulfonivorans]|uniref:Branched-chain amino acid ABC transporter permease n=1 Tax=Pseudarthrobacter sulfonivorans TaxID=121292 RepID=A0A0U3Q3T5_9MICC|nr:branched-chain amino acid ABC transporter permease [Pseudarthrobacter sulfonivorans]ALV39898.1 hypothetical protein AU252_00905 [Pseudarthrobacter sulfonivorans]